MITARLHRHAIGIQMIMYPLLIITAISSFVICIILSLMI